MQILPLENKLGGIVDMLLLLKDNEMDVADGKLKTPGVMVVIKLLSKLIPTFVAEVKLKIPKGTALI